MARIVFKRRIRQQQPRRDNVGRVIRRPRDPGVPRVGSSTQLADKNLQSEYAMPGAGGLEQGMR